jgi:addiction module HigA family antidote
MNRLEALKGDPKGQWSIRVNDQWRICFKWRNGDASTWSSRTTTGEETMIKREDLEAGREKLAGVTTGKRLPSVHLGEILNKEFLRPLDVSQYRLSKAIGVHPRRVNQIVHGKRGISADTALRLSKFFGTTAGFRMNLQSAYDLERARAPVNVDQIPTLQAA